MTRRPLPRWALIGAQAGGQLALVAVMPVLTRVVPVDELAGFQVGLSLGLILLPLATLRSELFLPTLVSEVECRKILRIAVISGTVVVLALGGSAAILALTGASAASVYVGCSALIVIAYGIITVDNAFLIRRGETWRLTFRNLLGGVVGALLQLLAALALPTALALTIAVLLGRLIAVAMTSNFRRRPTGASATDLSFEREWTPTRAMTAVTSSIVATANTQVLVIGSAVTAGQEAAAQMGIAQRAASAPIGLLSQGVTQAAQAEISPIIRSSTGSVKKVIIANMRAVLPLSLLLTVGLLVGGPLLAVPVFGEGWQDAGYIIAVLAIPSGLQLLVAPLLSVFVMLKREHLLLGIQSARLFVSMAAGLAVLSITSEFLAAVIAFAAANSLGYCLTILMMFKEVDRFDSSR